MKSKKKTDEKNPKPTNEVDSQPSTLTGPIAFPSDFIIPNPKPSSMSSLTTSADVIDLTAHFITGEYLDGRQVADLTIIGKAVKDGGVSANETTYGTAEEKRAAWENWQRAVDRLYKEDDSRTLKELCYLASKEVVGANGKAVKPDTIRHHIRNPASRRKFR